jgi:hypothetical protein
VEAAVQHEVAKITRLRVGWSDSQILKELGRRIGNYCV